MEKISELKHPPGSVEFIADQLENEINNNLRKLGYTDEQIKTLKEQSANRELSPQEQRALDAFMKNCEDILKDSQ